jgi:hypothetical protein
MPYTPKMAQERAAWMTLREALAHIEKAEHCSLNAAWTQLGEAVVDREVDARWPHAIGLTLGDWDDEDIGPPRDIRFWKSARYILGVGGKHARLKLIREGKPHNRSVLIRRGDVERIWPTASGMAEPQLPTESLSHGTEVSQTSVAPRKPAKAAIREEVIRIFELRSSNRPDENQLYHMVKEKLPGTSRSVVRRIVDEIGAGRPRGRPSKS